MKTLNNIAIAVVVIFGALTIFTIMLAVLFGMGVILWYVFTNFGDVPGLIVMLIFFFVAFAALVGDSVR